jgi:hypothetical protein
MTQGRVSVTFCFRTGMRQTTICLEFGATKTSGRAACPYRHVIRPVHAPLSRAAEAEKQNFDGHPLLATNVFAYFVSPGAPVYFPGAPFVAGAALLIGALALVWRFVRPAASISVPAPAMGEAAGWEPGTVSVQAEAR